MWNPKGLTLFLFALYYAKAAVLDGVVTVVEDLGREDDTQDVTVGSESEHLDESQPRDVDEEQKQNCSKNDGLTLFLFALYYAKAAALDGVVTVVENLGGEDDTQDVTVGGESEHLGDSHPRDVDEEPKQNSLKNEDAAEKLPDQIEWDCLEASSNFVQCTMKTKKGKIFNNVNISKTSFPDILSGFENVVGKSDFVKGKLEDWISKIFPQ